MCVLTPQAGSVLGHGSKEATAAMALNQLEPSLRLVQRPRLIDQGPQIVLGQRSWVVGKALQVHGGDGLGEGTLI